jgi:hypothetical protein
VVQFVALELSVRPETEVVQVVDAVAVDPEPSLVDVRAAAPGLVVAAVGGEPLV